MKTLNHKCNILPGFSSVWSNILVMVLQLFYLSREPRGFAFVQFLDPYDASEAQYHMNGQIFAGREISVVVAAESRKRPEEMRHKTRARYSWFSSTQFDPLISC